MGIMGLYVPENFFFGKHRPTSLNFFEGVFVTRENDQSVNFVCFKANYLQASFMVKIIAYRLLCLLKTKA